LSCSTDPSGISRLAPSGKTLPVSTNELGSGQENNGKRNCQPDFSFSYPLS
jgi:hypothetical protein